MKLGLAGGLGLIILLSGCNVVLEALAVKITGIPLPTITPTGTITPVGTTTPVGTATPSASVLFNSTIVGNSAVTAVAPYPNGFFSSSYDITNNPAGTGTITPLSATGTIQVTVSSGSVSSRPQIEFQFATSQNLIYLAPQNFSNILFTTFVPNTTSQIRFSIIDSGIAAAQQSYTIQIAQ